MAREIEHKFLVRDEGWRQQATHRLKLRQGYLISDEIRSVRVRIAADQAHLNIKSAVLGVSRAEYEYPIPLQDACELLDNLCRKPLLEKTRHFVPYGGHTWEVDEFEGDNAGLVLAEIELEQEGEAFLRPPWVGEEVSHDIRYYSSYLAEHPYRQWQWR